MVRTILPLLSWILQKVGGTVFTPTEWRAVALSMVPPSDSLVKLIMRECGYMDTSRLLSPSGRRRVRKGYHRYIRCQLRNNPYIIPVREWLLSQREKLEAQGGTADPSRIRKLRETEAETNDYFQQLLQSDEPPEELKSILKGSPDAANLLWEFALYGKGGTKPRIRRSSAMWEALDIDPDKLLKMSDVDGLIFFFDRFMALLGLVDQRPYEPSVWALARWVVTSHLPPENEPETTPEALDKAVEAGLIHRGIVTTDKETGLVAEIDVEDLNAANFIREVEEGGNQSSEAEGAQAESLVFQADAMECLTNFAELVTNFAELAGIDLNDFTLGEQARLLSLLDAHKKGYEKASKKGIAYKDAYGQRADSEKTQRARLFKKIREKARHGFTE